MSEKVIYNKNNLKIWKRSFYNTTMWYVKIFFQTRTKNRISKKNERHHHLKTKSFCVLLKRWTCAIQSKHIYGIRLRWRLTICSFYDFKTGIMMIRTYITAIVLALINFIYIYFVKFDSLSEEKLILYAPVWSLLFIFGIYGLLSTKLIKQVNEGKYQNTREALVQSSKSFGIFGPFRQILFFPLIFLNLKNTFQLAIVSTMIWAVILVLFFQFIFPKF